MPKAALRFPLCSSDKIFSLDVVRSSSDGYKTIWENAVSANLKFLFVPTSSIVVVVVVVAAAAAPVVLVDGEPRGQEEAVGEGQQPQRHHHEAEEL